MSTLGHAIADSSGTLTEGLAVGTPHYMAPEQASGEEVDTRADLYALAAVAYRALTGQLPFPGEDLARVYAALLGEMPVAPSRIANLSRDVDLCFAVALAKHPQHRFQTPEELSDAFAAATRSDLDNSVRKRAEALLKDLPFRTPSAGAR